MSYPVEQLARNDPSSFANAEWAQTTAFHIDMTPDFETQIFDTILDLEVTIRKDGAKCISLDISGQEVSYVELIDALQGVPANTRVKYDQAVEKCPLGSRCVIEFPGTKEYKSDEKVFFRVHYKTSRTASAVQFLPKEQTNSGKYPYLYTQCQAIHARSLLIIQDSCGSKAAYTAVVRLKKEYGPLVALMSAIPDSPLPTEENDMNVFKFTQQIPIPSYLFALAIGELSNHSISDRCSVYAEPADITIAAREYEDLEVSLKMIEGLCGEYRWGKYNVVNMIFPFPFGGMENPINTFASGSLLPLPRQKLHTCKCSHLGDEKLGIASSVAIHEMCHSWSGNLVTNQDWCHFWLNEGMTVFAETRTQRKLHGTGYEGLHRLIGWEDLKDSVNMYEEVGQPEYSRLVVDLKGDIDPDDVFSSVPYMKGSNFLFYLEEIMGGPERFEPFVKYYFDTFAWKTVNSDQFKDFYLNYCTQNGFTERINEIDWESWYYKPGMPVNYTPKVDMTLANAAWDLADLLCQVDSDNIDINAIQAEERFTTLAKWSSTQQTVFLDKVMSHFDDNFAKNENKSKTQNFFLTKTIPAIKNLVSFGTSPNSELFSRWLNLYIKSGANPSDIIAVENDKEVTLEDSVKFLLSSVGRMKFVRPLFRLMLKSNKFSPLAAQIFNQNKQKYHTICSNMVDKDLKNPTNAAAALY
jgi:leukotriene-A4 hydrolase